MAGSSAAPFSSAGPKASSGKDAGNGKNTKDNGNTTTDNSGTSGSGGDPTIVTGLAMLPLPVASMAIAPDPNQPASSDAQGGSVDPLAPVNADSPGKSSDPNGASTPSSPVAAGLAAMVPGIQTIVAAPAPAPSAVTPKALAGSAPATLPIPAPVSGTPSAPTSSASLDTPSALAATSQQPDGTAFPHPPVAAAAQDSVVGSAPAAEFQNAMAPALTAMAGASGAPNHDPKSNPSLTPLTAPPANPGNPSPLAGAAPLNPLLLGTSTASADSASEQTPANPGAARESDPAFVALPAEVAARFAASIRATDESTSDASPDTLLASAGGTDAAARVGNDQPGAIQPTFNAAVPAPLQSAPVVLGVPPHAALTTGAVSLAGIPIAIAARVEAGEKHFEIRLDPPDLGRIEVQLSVDSSGRATSHLVVDRADTLDLLRRDAPALERALHSAGLTTDDGALQFSLRHQSFAGRDQGTPAPLPPPAAPAPAESDLAPIDAAVRRYGPPMGLGSGIDIRV